MIIVAIVAILATLAVAAYRGYQNAARDQEAIAGLHQLAAQATNAINDWGIQGAGGTITPGCLPLNPNNLAPDIAVEWEAMPQWNDLGLSLEGVQRWRYRICFFTAGADNNNENFLVSANLLLRSNERVAFFGTGMDRPLFDTTTLPFDFTDWDPYLLSK